LTSNASLLVKHYLSEEPTLREGKNRPLDESHEEMTMKKANLLAVLAVTFMVAGCSNHTQQVISRTAAPTSAGMTSLFPSGPTSQTVSEAPEQPVAAPVQEITERAKPYLLPAIAAALHLYKKEFCQDSQSANCDKDFMQSFHYRKVTLSKSGQVGFIVEFSGVAFCGSAGCTLNVLKQTGNKFEATFENDEVGSLDSFEFATTTTNGFYDLTKHGSDGMDYYYAWTGSNYEDAEAPLSFGQARTVAVASKSAQKE
jgi:uncharacterized lipoprotein NlpE involved in copper resistance